jgi:hypothetical protein
MGTPATSSLIDHSRFWRVQMSMKDTLAWFRAHPPAGLSENGSSQGFSPSQKSAGVSYSAPDSPAWRGAALEVGVAATGATVSDIRVDALTEWWDPVPMQVTVEGPRLRIAVADPCPASDRGYVSVQNAGDDLSSAVLPSGAPTGALVCSYEGMNGTTYALQRSTSLDPTEAGKLAAAIAGTSLNHLDDVVRSCPRDDTSMTVLAFSYPGRQDVDIWYHRTGCRSISNGSIVASPSEAFMDLAANFAG